MDHTYEEIRKAAIEVTGGGSSQYNTLKENVSKLFEQRQGGAKQQRGRITHTYLPGYDGSLSLSAKDQNLLLQYSQ
jgi:protein-arginine kinase activator protein McsA